MSVLLPEYIFCIAYDFFLLQLSLQLCRLRSETMRPVFCGNLEYDTRQSEVERLFKRYGSVERVDMKTGFCGSIGSFHFLFWLVLMHHLPLFYLKNQSDCHGITIVP
ncbi:hypothetical protein Droror1_Dr00000465 [Drosera rotundifolia]